ncbi:MAG: hypothetical protein HRU06_09010 [Oceanospirillaceae bacterium]|nr:hypothetical protein [Oceanospirillaceae bacterium]
MSFFGFFNFGSSESNCDIKNTSVPCDVKKLKVTENISNKTLVCDRVLRDEDVKEYPVHLQKHLKEFDLVIELMSDYDKGYGVINPKKKVELQIEAEIIGQCPDSQHLKIELDGEGKCRDWTNSPVPVIPLLPKASISTGGAGKWLAPYWAFGSEGANLYKIRALSCGVREEGSCNTELSALVIVYPIDVYQLKFSLPPLGKWSGKRKGSIDITGTTTKERSSSFEQFGKIKSEDSEISRANSKIDTQLSEIKIGRSDGTGYSTISEATGIIEGNVHHSETETYQDGSSLLGVANTYEIKAFDSTDSNQGLKITKKIKIKPGISLKKNGQELNITNAANDIINVYQNIIEGIEKLKNFRPSIGWSFDIELKIFEGSIAGEWGKKESELTKTERYISVEEYYEIKAEIVLFHLKILLMIGIDIVVKSWVGTKLLEVTAKVEGAIEGGITLNDTFQSFGNKNSVNIEALCAAKLGVYGVVNLAGYYNYALGGELNGGFDFKGEFIVDKSIYPQLKGEFSRRETTIKGWLKKDGVDDKPYKSVLYDKGSLWKGTLPG